MTAPHREQQTAERSEKLNAPIDANRAAPPSGGDGSPGPYGNVGGYNNFWLDPGSRFTTVDGRLTRTSRRRHSRPFAASIASTYC